MDSDMQEISKKYAFGANKIIYKETLLVDSFLSKVDSIENFEVHDDDIWLCGFPKSGTIWTQEMVWNIVNDLNFEAARSTYIYERVPFFEYTTVFECKEKQSQKNDFTKPLQPACLQNSIEFVKNSPRPRLIKTHLPFRLLPRQLRMMEKKAKIVYIWRNPKDVCISHYHFTKWMKSYTGDFTDFCKLYLNDAVMFMPFWNHVIEFWNRRNETNILILKYEDMKADLPCVIRKTAKFFDKNLNEEQISKLEKHLNFSSMSTNASVNFEQFAKLCNLNTEAKFLRKGEASQWKTEMPSEMVDQFDAWTQENLKNHESLLRELS